MFPRQAGISVILTRATHVAPADHRPDLRQRRDVPDARAAGRARHPRRIAAACVPGPGDRQDLGDRAGGSPVHRLQRAGRAAPGQAGAAGAAVPRRARRCAARARAHRDAHLHRVVSQPTTPTPVVSNRQALEILSRAGEVLTGSLALDRTIETGLQLVVPAIADWAAVVVEREDGRIEEITSGHADPEIEAALLGIRRRRRDETGGSESLAVADTGQPVLASDISGMPAPDDLEEAEQRAIERLNPRSYMLVPLAARGRIFGALTLL